MTKPAKGLWWVKDVWCNHDGYRYCVGFETPDARYHIWLNPDTKEPEGTLYKNPPKGVEYRSPGHSPGQHFHTRKLSNPAIIAAMMKAVADNDLIAKADAENLEKRRQAQAKNLEGYRAELVEAAAPDLLKALRNLLTYSTPYFHANDSTDIEVLKEAQDAIDKATKLPDEAKAAYNLLTFDC